MSTSDLLVGCGYFVAVTVLCVSLCLAGLRLLILGFRVGWLFEMVAWCLLVCLIAFVD